MATITDILTIDTTDAAAKLAEIEATLDRLIAKAAAEGIELRLLLRPPLRLRIKYWLGIG